MPPVDTERPTLLLLGDGESMSAGLQEALGRHATFAEATDASSPVAAVMAAAPDVVLLVGDAARNHESIIRKLRANPLTARTPVVLLSPGGLGIRLSAARRGVTVVQRSASIDGMAKEIASLARELPQKPLHGGGAGEASLNELLEILRKELQGGIVSVTQEGSAQSTRFVLKPGRNVEGAIRDFVRRIKPLIKTEKPLRYEFDTLGAGHLGGLIDGGEADLEIFKERRILLVEDDAASADALAQELRAHGATVAVCTSIGGGLARARTLDPEVLLVDESALDSTTGAVLQEIRRDLNLRWASVLVARLRQLLPPGLPPRVDRLAASLKPLLAADREVTRRIAQGTAFETRLEALGPSRLLHALANSGATLQVTIRHPRALIELSIAEGLIAGAEAIPMGDAAPRTAGAGAIAALQALGSGRVSISHRDAPTLANLLMPVKDAVHAAYQETPPIRPSQPPPRHQTVAQSAAPAPASAAPTGALIGELQRLVDTLKERETVPPEVLAGTEAAIRDVQSSTPPVRNKGTMLGMPAVSGTMAKVPPQAEAGSASATAANPVAPNASAVAKAPARPQRPKKSTMLGMPAIQSANAQAAPPEAAGPQPNGDTFFDSFDDLDIEAQVSGLSPTSPNAPAAKPRVPPAVAVPPKAPIPPKLAIPAKVPAPGKTADAKPPEPQAPVVPAREPAAESAPMPAPAQNEHAHDAATESAPEPPETPFSGSASPALATPAEALTEPAPPPPIVGAEAFGDVAFEETAGVRPPSSNPPAPRNLKPLIAAAAVVLLGAGGFAALHAFDLLPTLDGPGSVQVAAAPGDDAVPDDATPDPEAPAAQEHQTAQAEAEHNAANGETAAAAASESVAEETTADEATAAAADEAAAAEAAPDEASEATAAEAAPDEATDEATADEADTATTDDAEPASPEAAQVADNSDAEAPPAGDEGADPLAEAIRAANFFRGRGNFTQAERQYQRALRLSPRNGRVLAGLTRLEMARRNHSAAIAYARRLVRARPRNASNRVLLGDALRASGNEARAQRAFQAALEIDPNNRTARRRLR